MGPDHLLQPSQPQKWDPIAGFRLSLSGAVAQKELRFWSILAVSSLAVAGIFALLLAISRLPGADSLFPWPVAFYERSLIIHVIMSFVVWFVACGMIFAQIAAYRISDGTPRSENMGRTAAVALLAAFFLLGAPALMDSGVPSLNNYVPAIIDPIYYIGLLLVAFGAVMGAARVFINLSNRQGALEPIGTSGITASVIVILTIAAFAISWNHNGGMPNSPAENEDVFWAGGHILQFFNVAIMIGAWLFLVGRIIGEPPVRPKVAMIAYGILGLLALGGLLLLFVEEPLSVAERDLFTQYQYALAPVPTFIGLLVAAALIKAPKSETEVGRSAAVCVWLSMALFFVGGFLGIFVDGTDTRTPAHYHAVIGAVNIALMGFLYLFVLPVLGRGITKWRAVRASLWLYGLGQLLHSVGLFIAGGYGAPRKVAGTSPGLDVIGNWIGHVGIGIGGVIAVLGGVMFIWMCGKKLLKASETN